MATFTANLKSAVRLARKEDPRLVGRVPLVGTEFFVIVESVRIRPSGGACRAFGYLYSLEDSKGQRPINGVDRADSFVSVANHYLQGRKA